MATVTMPGEGLMIGESRDGHVVVGVDASRHAALAADWAATEAMSRGATLHLIHASDMDPGSALIGPIGEPAADPARSAQMHILARTEYRVRMAHPALPVVVELVHDGAAGALVDASRTAQLLVLGTRGHGAFAGLVLGSVSMRVTAHGHCPVVLLRSPEHADRSGEIVLGMELGECHEAARFAFDAADRAGCGVHAVHAWIPYPGHAQTYISDTDIIARHAAQDMVAALKQVREDFPSVPAKITVTRGHPAAVLAGASREARLTVVGAHRHRGPLSLGVGPVIHTLLTHAGSPVAVVPVA